MGRRAARHGLLRRRGRHAPEAGSNQTCGESARKENTAVPHGKSGPYESGHTNDGDPRDIK